MRLAMFESATGRIVQIMESPMGIEDAAAAMPEGMSLLEVDHGVSDDTHFIRSGEAQTFPEKPHPLAPWDWDSHSWGAPLLGELKQSKLRQIKSERDRRIAAPQATDVGAFNGGASGASNINAVVLMLRAVIARGGEDHVRFTLANNVRVGLTLAQLENAALQVGAAIQALHETCYTLRQQIDAAQTLEEVEAVAWPT